MTRPLWLLAPALAAACVIPDQDIVINDQTITNRSPLRIVEPLRLSSEAQEACDELNPDIDGATCPQPPPDDPTVVLPRYLNPSDYFFCSCPVGSFDNLAQPDFAILIEDRDRDTSNVPDEIYAALLLDYDARNPRPHNSVRYRDYVNPQVPVPLASGIEYKPIGQHEPILRELRLGDENRRFDFCNGANDTPLSPGYHTLTVIATDRPWFVPDDGSIHEGVPDLADGASFDTITYVFHCYDSATESCRTSQCETLEAL